MVLPEVFALEMQAERGSTGKPHVAHNSGCQEWYTPAEYVEAARRVLGAIELDPASCDFANRVVQAARFHTVHDNGLQQPWSGRVWLNPPYDRGLVRRFIARLVHEHQVGTVPAAILLVNNATETKWFQQAARAASCICYLAKRVCFYNESGPQDSPLQGQAFLYFGVDTRRFRREFQRFGLVTAAKVVAVTQCQQCSTAFVARADARYCSAACRQTAYRQRKSATPTFPPGTATTQEHSG
jgi:hypothetical protein